MSFFLLLWSPIYALLSPMAEVKFYLALCYIFFLSFLALLKSSGFWMEVGTEALALDLFPW